LFDARTGAGTSIHSDTRNTAATDAGLSERQRKTALRIANIPEDAEIQEYVYYREPLAHQLSLFFTVFDRLG
jgi:hypothetical protein